MNRLWQPENLTDIIVVPLSTGLSRARAPRVSKSSRDPAWTAPVTGQILIAGSGGHLYSRGMELMRKNLTRTASPVTAESRAELLLHGGLILWLTGLSGAGKSTYAAHLQYQLHLRGMAAVVLDGDNLRHGLCSNLSFSPEDRSENVRRIGEVAKLMAEAGLIAICSLISPYRADRDRVREICRRDGIPFAEIFVNTPLAVCEERDPRGLYKRARAGEIKDFTGVNAPYEAPASPELEIRTAEGSMEDGLAALMDLTTGLVRNFPRQPDCGPGFGI